jgi:hypothetical protein
MQSKIEIIIEAHNENYDESDDRWIDQVDELIADCEREAGEVRKEVQAVEGKKGGVEAIILALGSAGALTAAVDIFKAWILRDRSRNLTLKITTPEGVQEWVVSGNAMDNDVIEKFMQTALEMSTKKEKNE